MIKRRILIAVLAAALIFTALAAGGTTALARGISVRVLWEPSLDADVVYDFREGIAAVRIFDTAEGAFRLGYVNRYGLTVIPFWSYPPLAHWQTPEFADGLVSVYSPETEVTGFFDSTGTPVIPFLYDRIPGRALTFADGLAAVSLGGSWGFIDTHGIMQIPFEFERAGDFSDGLAPVMLGGQWGFIDTAGTVVIPFVLEHFSGETEGNLFIQPGFSEGLAAILLPAPDGLGYRWGFLNRAGNRIAAYMYHHVMDFTEGRALVMREDDNGIPVYGFIDSMGEEIAPLIYSFALCFSEGLAAVRYGGIETGLWGFIDHYGSVQVPVRYDDARSFSEGLAAVRSGAAWGFIDRWGSEAVPAVYSEVRDFSQGLAAVKIGEGAEARWGFIDRAGNIVVPIEYLDAQSFSEGLAWVRGPMGWGVLEIDPDAEPGLEPEESHIRYIHRDLAYYLVFTPPPGALNRINSPAVANEAISAAVGTLTPAQRQSGEVLNIVTLLIENAVRRGTSQALPAGGSLNAAVLQSSAEAARDIGQAALAGEDIQLMRLLNVNIGFTSNERDALHLTFPDDVSGIDFDNVTVEAGFAAVTLNRRHIPPGSEIRIERGAPVFDFVGATNITGSNLLATIYIEVDSVTAATGISSIFGDDFTPADLLNFWSVGVVTLLMIIWGIFASMGRKLRYWVVPTFSVLAIGINIWTLSLSLETREAADTRAPGYFDSIAVTMPPGMRAVVSIPTGGANPERLVLYNEHGEPQLSRHNPITNTIDARIQTGGTFHLRTHELSFADIAATSPQSQRAILKLAAVGIMPGTPRDTGYYFRPDSTITRAELAAAVVMALGLPDTAAPNRFTDITPYDWYYRAVATAVAHNLMQGFDDGTFRGDWAITKQDMVLTVAEALMGHIGYQIPPNTENILLRYHDRDLLELWAAPAIALATAADVLIYREDGLFAPNSVMTRGDAAVVLYRLFSRVW